MLSREKTGKAFKCLGVKNSTYILVPYNTYKTLKKKAENGNTMKVRILIDVVIIHIIYKYNYFRIKRQYLKELTGLGTKNKDIMHKHLHPAQRGREKLARMKGKKFVLIIKFLILYFVMHAVYFYT